MKFKECYNMRCKKIFSCVCVLLLLVLVACQDGKNKVGPIAKITIDGKKPIGGIKENMNFGVTNAKKVKVEVETSSKDLVVTYTPALQDGLWNLVLEKENELTISVKGSGNPTVYKAKITHEIEHNFGEEVDKDIIDFLQIEGLAVDENVQTVPDEQTGRILKGQDEIIELTGPFAIIRLGHKDNEDGTPYTATKLKTVKVNSVDMIKTSFPQVTSAFAKGVEMPLNDVLDVKIEAETEDGKKTNVVFKIRRVEGTVDIPSMYMYVEEDAMIEDSYPLNFLTKGDGQGKFPLFDGDEPTKVRIGVLYDGLIESIEIDGESRKPEEKPIKIKKDGKEIDKWYCVEKSITGIAPSGKDVVIKVTPIDKTEFTTTTLKFSFFL